MASKNRLALLSAAIALCLAMIGWYVLFSQNPVILLLARQRYNQAVSAKTDLSRGPCLGKISDDWVLDIAHLPRVAVDNLPENQCSDFLNGKARHFVEMTAKGEVVLVQ